MNFVANGHASAHSRRTLASNTPGTAAAQRIYRASIRADDAFTGGRTDPQQGADADLADQSPTRSLQCSRSRESFDSGMWEA
jgi:hypothetical protein